jgi:hypothetical protein
MIKNKILALTGALLCATITVAAAAPPVSTTDRAEIFKLKIALMVNNCRDAYSQFKYGKDKGARLEQYLKSYPDNEKPMLAFICRGYGEGYEDGRRGLV